MIDTYSQTAVRPPRRMVRELPQAERPFERACHIGVRALSVAELLALVLTTPDALDLAYEILRVSGGLAGLYQASRSEITSIPGVGDGLAIRLQAAVELGRRYVTTSPAERPYITSPGDAASLLMAEMQDLPQEHLRVILLDTRNRVISVPTIYVGSLNTSVVRVGELFRMAISSQAAAVIVAHNHPSGCASPSPEDVAVTRHIVQAGELLAISVLDHIIIGRNSFVSLKERCLGFEL
jgi:DNA repair protein RadC